MKINHNKKKNSSLINISMVAELAGVSPSTVSRVINGTAVVSETKNKAITSAIKTLGFSPNPMARGLAGGRTLSVGVITQALDSPFYGAALRGIEVVLIEAGYSSLFVSGHWNAQEEARCIDVLRARRVDGIIVLTGRLSDQQLKNCAKDLCVVVTGRSVKAPNLYAMNFDNLEGARLATEHLIHLGHKKIAFITGDAQHPDAIERERGYQLALENAQIKYDPDLTVKGLYSEDSGFEAMRILLTRGKRFSAVFAANDQMALGATLLLHQHEIRIPEEVAVIGFDDLPVCSYSHPPLSSVCHPAHEIGKLAAQAILDLLRGKSPDLKLPPPTLVIRQSTRQNPVEGK